MFDVGFLELLVVGVVALLVIGPERLPKLARTAGMWVGRGRRFVSSVKADIEQELKTEEAAICPIPRGRRVRPANGRRRPEREDLRGDLKEQVFKLIASLPKRKASS